MSEEWPDDDARFTGPGCSLDKIGGIASGKAFRPSRVARKHYVVCEIVPAVEVFHRRDGSRLVGGSVIRMVKECDHELMAEYMAREHAIKIADEGNPRDRVVTVMPVWRVK